MPTRLTSVVIDSANPPTLARWWAAALGWELSYEDDDESDVDPPSGQPGLELTFVPVTDERVVKNRIHLDLRSTSQAEQDDLIQRLMAAGATEADIGQVDVPWAVLADPEGNEFCVLDPRPHYSETGALAAIVVDALDPNATATFWEAASGWHRQRNPSGVDSLRPPDGHGPWLEFLPNQDPRVVKNRIHLDVAPYPDDDQAEEVARLLNLGALRAEVGQTRATGPAVGWVVLTDPDGNEFCVLSAR